MGPKGKTQTRRLDDALVEQGLAQDLREARGLIMSGRIIVDDQRIDKPGQMIGLGQSIRRKTDKGQFVSRGGEKLANVVSDIGIAETVRGQRVLDLGASTGGFTDVCLTLGASAVTAVDVGTNQLDFSLRSNPRVTVLERTDVRELDPLSPCPNFVVADISFNSLARLAVWIVRVAPKKGTRFLLLVKPQFELDEDRIPEGGVVTEQADRDEALRLVWEAFDRLPVTDKKTIPARPEGRAGNQEYFIHFVLSSDYAE